MDKYTEVGSTARNIRRELRLVLTEDADLAPKRSNYLYTQNRPSPLVVVMSTENVVSPDLKVKASIKNRSQSEKGGRKKRKRDDVGESQPPSKKSRPKPTHKTDEDTKSSTPSSQVETSPFHLQTSSLYLPLSPITQLYPLKGLCAEHLSPLLLTYYSPFHGVVLSYSNVRLSEDPSTSESATDKVLARSVDEYAVSYTWVTADFLIFRPQRGGWIEGWVNLQNEGHLGLVCWNLFNASIERKRLPQSWRWVRAGSDSTQQDKQKTRRNETVEEQGSEEMDVDGVTEGEGYFEDSEGNKIEGAIRFRVRDLESTSSSDKERGFLSIEGSMLSDEEEIELLAHKISASRGSGKPKLRKDGGNGKATISGVLGASHKDAFNEMIDIVQPRKSKHRVDY